MKIITAPSKFSFTLLMEVSLSEEDLQIVSDTETQSHGVSSRRLEPSGSGAQSVTRRSRVAVV